jgi:hypothetical protein
MEESSAAYSYTSLKVCKVQNKCMVLTCIIVNKSMCGTQLNLAKLLPKNLPWFPENSDKTTWPQITGTSDPILRFQWDKAWEDDDYFYSICMIIGYMKLHGSNVVPAATGALLKISKEDLQKRVIEKFVSLQKGLCNKGYLGSRNQCILIKVPEVLESTGEQAEASGGVDIQVKLEEKAKRAKILVLASRAVGVSCTWSFKYSALISGHHRN